MKKTTIEQGKIKDLDYSICRVNLGMIVSGIRSSWYTAYVILPAEHPWRGFVNEMSVPLVSQECTYKKGMEIGWDYNHYGSPEMTIEGVRKDVEAVILEVLDALCKQLPC